MLDILLATFVGFIILLLVTIVVLLIMETDTLQAVIGVAGLIVLSFIVGAVVLRLL